MLILHSSKFRVSRDCREVQHNPRPCTPVELECSLDQTAEEARETQIALWAMIDRDPSFFVSGLKTSEPSFTRLFTHDTWADYTGRRPLTRWLIVTKTWRFSTILRAVFPIAFVASLWAYVISSLPAALLPRTSPVPMSLMGTALGLLLVFLEQFLPQAQGGVYFGPQFRHNPRDWSNSSDSVALTRTLGTKLMRAAPPVSLCTWLALPVAVHG